MATALIGFIGTTELVLILVIVVLVFGVGKLPDVGKALGAGIKNFKSEVATPPAAPSEPAQLADTSNAAPPVPRDVTDEVQRRS